MSQQFDCKTIGCGLKVGYEPMSVPGGVGALFRKTNVPQTTSGPAETGAGKPGNAAARKEARKPRATKAGQAATKSKDGTAPKPRRSGRPRKGGGAA